MRSLFIAAALLAGAVPSTLSAQADTVGPRVERLEQQMRAVQRKVFPGGDGRFFEPEIAAPTVTPDPLGAPATTPVADLTARVSALEEQLRTLTGQSEQNAFKLRQLEEAFAQYRGDIERRLNTSEGAGAAGDTGARAGGTADPRPGAVAPDRQAALEAIAMPATGDAGEDAYTYGFRLWEAKFYPEAQAQLKDMIAKHPRHRRVSFARNLLGRAYLDDGKHGLAGKTFYENYETQPDGPRASESLYYFGVALIRAKQPANACQAFAEFDTVYGATAGATLKGQVARARAEAKCG